ncbi:MAG TPA: ArsA-related P-loop ATPase [Solirubrobacteraceae bacterium]|jgi:anion-transporting  ArsA/GET3 family ATPase|nr:ArsA-related P-loop ATPase [Solirubrobacteraceae bacterium]
MAPNRRLDRMLDRRLLFVTGKGGVGRTTVAAVLGLVAAGRGLRTIVAAVGGRDELPRLLGPDEGRPGRTGDGDPAGERDLGSGLFSIAIDPQQAMEEYLRDQLRVGALADMLSSSRTFGYLAAATPGLRELLTVGKVWELAQPERRAAGGDPYDLVIVDAPATGYAISLMAAPRTFAALARRGPISRHAATIHETLVDPRMTGVVGVTTAAEPAVNEILETGGRLERELGIGLDGVIVNALRPSRFARRDRARLRAALAGDPTPAVRQALILALAADDEVRVERAQLRRVTEGVTDRPFELPLIRAEELGREALIGVGKLLEEAE